MNTKVNRKKIRKVAQKIIDEFQPEKIILFGSWAWGYPKPDSDVDLFVVKRGQRDPLEMMRDIDRILFGRTIPVDILTYTPEQVENRKLLGDPFVKRILNSGQVLYEKK